MNEGQLPLLIGAMLFVLGVMAGTVKLCIAFARQREEIDRS